MMNEKKQIKIQIFQVIDQEHKKIAIRSFFFHIVEIIKWFTKKNVFTVCIRKNLSKQLKNWIRKFIIQTTNAIDNEY